MKSITIFLLSIVLVSLSTAQIPDWYSTHTHPKYPASMFIIGIGSAAGATGAEAAKKSALSDIVSQFRVQLQSEL